MASERDSIIEKLRKISALASRGVGGERENARKQLDKLLSKHGIDISELNAEELSSKYYTFGYSSKSERSLLFQCYCRAVQKSSAHYLQLGRGKIGFKLNLIQYLELESIFSHFKPLLRKELDLLVKAFMYKHSIFGPMSEDDSGEESYDKQEIRALLNMMAGLRETNYVSPKKQLNGVVK